jgi:hypothetical protein
LGEELYGAVLLWAGLINGQTADIEDCFAHQIESGAGCCENRYSPCPWWVIRDGWKLAEGAIYLDKERISEYPGGG